MLNHYAFNYTIDDAKTSFHFFETPSEESGVNLFLDFGVLLPLTFCIFGKTLTGAGSVGALCFSFAETLVLRWEDRHLPHSRPLKPKAPSRIPKSSRVALFFD